MNNYDTTFVSNSKTLIYQDQVIGAEFPDQFHESISLRRIAKVLVEEYMYRRLQARNRRPLYSGRSFVCLAIVAVPLF